MRQQHDVRHDESLDATDAEVDELCELERATAATRKRIQRWLKRQGIEWDGRSPPPLVPPRAARAPRPAKKAPPLA